MNNLERIKITLDAVNAVKVQLNTAEHPLDKIDALKRLETLRVVLEEECELAIDMMLAKSA